MIKKIIYFLMISIMLSGCFSSNTKIVGENELALTLETSILNFNNLKLVSDTESISLKHSDFTLDTNTNTYKCVKEIRYNKIINVIPYENYNNEKIEEPSTNEITVKLKTSNCYITKNMDLSLNLYSGTTGTIFKEEIIYQYNGTDKYYIDPKYENYYIEFVDGENNKAKFKILHDYIESTSGERFTGCLDVILKEAFSNTN